jgi:transposase InsO family protein
MKGAHPVEGLCELLQVSRSGYYRWRRARPSRRATQDAALSEHIVRFHARSRRTYGSPRIVQDLQEQKLRISRRRCARLMREHGLQGRKRHRRRPCTTDSRHGHAPAPNQLLQRAKPTGPDQVWVTDITYVPTEEGFLYLAAILDGWSRRVVGWACGPTLHASLALTALRKAIQERRPAPGVLHHSDQGVQYASGEYRQALQVAGLDCSMSRRGNCYDNEMMESFWSTLKTEAGLDSVVPLNRRAAESIIFDYIECFYNRSRRHSSLGYLSPVAFEQQPTIKDTSAA